MQGVPLMAQSQSDRAPAGNPDAGERHADDLVLTAPALSSTPFSDEQSPDRRGFTGPSDAGSGTRVDNLPDELTSCIESLRVFVSEDTEDAADATRYMISG
jgi:hypothetical protein